ncbi:MAG: hypothetical protein K0Q55_118 [Verrucomicrobia bacterium]|jgi:hypothetical protein|nr:hypothetical protein [Verrucomicrobiota bacterium]
MNSKETNSAATSGGQETHPTHEEIAKEAFRLYEKNGRKEGHDLEYWLEAEKTLGAKTSVHTASNATVKEPMSPLEFAESKERRGNNGGPEAEKTRKNSANREEIRQATPPRTAPRQSQRPQTHSA